MLQSFNFNKGRWRIMSNSLVTFYGPNREYFFVNVPEAYSEKCFTCTNCNKNCEAGKIVQNKIVCMSCVYPGASWCSK